MSDDYFAGGSGNDSIFAGEGNDTLVGGDGDDLLYGGEDADTLTGGAGADVFAVFPVADEPDLITDWSDEDAILVRGVALTPDDIERAFDGAETLLTIALPQGEALTIRLTGDQFAATPLTYESDLGTYIAYRTPASVIGDVIEGTAGADALDGTARNDTIDGAGGNDTVHAAGGQDEVRGGDGDDWLSGGGGSDLILGGGGDDELRADAGNDTLRGGAGEDTIYAGSLSDGPSTGRVLAEGGAGNDEFWLAADDVTVRGGEGADRLGGRLWTEAGIVDFDGGAGDDVAVAELSSGRVAGGEGFDELTIRGSVVRVAGTERDPAEGLVLTYQAREDGFGAPLGEAPLDLAVRGFELVHLYDEEGFGLSFNLFAGGTGADVVRGADLNAEGYEVPAMIFGGDGADTITGTFSDDWLSGGAGADVIDAGGGRDRLLAETLADLDGDVVTGLTHEGHVRIAGTALDASSVSVAADEAGVLVTFADHAVTFRLNGGDAADAYQLRMEGADALFGARLRHVGEDFAEIVFGGVMDDDVAGGGGDDSLYGEEGDDALRGDGGADRIAGGSGDDVLFGGSGDDVLYGDAAGWDG